MRSQMMVKAFLLSALMSVVGAVCAGSVNGVPMKDYHIKAFGSALTCEACHETALPKERPTEKACIQCHGTMDKIKTPPNEFNKFPHASDHYGDTVPCTACHAEHKASQDLCSTCHRVKWQSFQ